MLRSWRLFEKQVNCQSVGGIDCTIKYSTVVKVTCALPPHVVDLLPLLSRIYFIPPKLAPTTSFESSQLIRRLNHHFLFE